MSVEGSTTVITGTLGGGKTLAAMSLALDHLSRGGTVITNVPVFRDLIAAYLRAEFGLVMDDSRLVSLNTASIADFHNFAMRGNDELCTMMVLDEAALDVSSRDWKSHSDEQFNFVILCRKLRINLVLIAQDANDIDKRIRQKMQREIHCRSLKNMPWVGGLVKLPVFVRVTYTIEIGKRPQRIGASWHWKGEAWGLFDSHALHGEKAQLFGALAVAATGGLQRVQYPIWPYVVAAVWTWLVACFASSLCLLAN